MVALPVSRAEIALKEADGVDEMLLHEAAGGPIQAGLELLARLYGEAVDAPGLTVTDFEYLLLRLRAARLGENMSLGFACPHCREPAEVSFKIADYLADVRPRPARGVSPDTAKPGWFRLGEAGFKLPTVDDQAAAQDDPRPAHRLAELCLDESARRRPHRSRVERAMEAMAPPVSREIAGQCAACGAGVRAEIAVTPLVISELKRAAGAVHDEVDLIARAYHWPESTFSPSHSRVDGPMPSESGAPSYRPPDVPRRSYLQRLAQPLSPGLPVLFAAPRAAPDEARPAAVAPIVQPPAPVLRRAAAAPPAAGAVKPAAPSAPRVAQSFANSPAVVSSGPPTRAAPKNARAASRPPRPSVVPAAEVHARPTDGRVVQPGSPISAEDPPFPGPVHPQAASISPAAAAAFQALAAATPPAVGSPAVAPPTSARPPSAHSAQFVEPLRPSPVRPSERQRATPLVEVSPLDPPRIAPAATSEHVKSAAPRIHIGAVEVRTTPPPFPTALPPVASPPGHVLGGASAPVSRAYGWRFGLIQS